MAQGGTTLFQGDMDRRSRLEVTFVLKLQVFHFLAFTQKPVLNEDKQFQTKFNVSPCPKKLACTFKCLSSMTAR